MQTSGKTCRENANTHTPVVTREGEGFAEVGRLSSMRMSGEQEGFWVFPEAFEDTLWFR